METSLSHTLGILFTFTTYGTWLRGDERGWVDDGSLMAPSPHLEAADRARLKHEPFLLASQDFLRIGQMIGDSLRQRMGLRILALTVQTWHVHLVVASTTHEVSAIAKCAKDAVRWGLRPGRPIWTDDYDKRFCYDEPTLANRIVYAERHNVAIGLPPRPWAFIETPFA
jgi:hypothetical protein